MFSLSIIMLKNVDSDKHETWGRKLKYAWLYLRVPQILNAALNYIWWNVSR
jgi:hypothetical protein